MTVRTLVVDDVADLRHLVRVALRLHGGFEVVGEAGDGEQAVELAAATMPDVIVLDLALPHLAGTELIARLRDAAPGAKIVVFTGTTDSADGVGAEVEGFVAKTEDVEALVTHLEQVAAPAVTAELELPAAPDAAAMARAFVRERSLSWGCDDVVDAALLVVSELVTNAFVHAGSRCTVRAVRRPGVLRLEVADAGEGSPDPHVASDEDEHGRGLLLVSAMTEAWGVEPAAGGGKVVWAELGVAPEM